MTHPSLGLALGLPPGGIPPHLTPAYTTSGQLPPVAQPTSGRNPALLIGQSQAAGVHGRSQPIVNQKQKKEGIESGKKLGNVKKQYIRKITTV